MTAQFTVTVTLDAAAIELEAKRRGFTLTRALESALSDIENRLVDSISHRDCVLRVGSELQREYQTK